MLLHKDELHVLNVALMIAIDQIGRNTDGSKDGERIREEYLPKMRALLDRLSN